MEILSDIKPKVEQKPEVKIEWNDRSYESYVKSGFGHVLESGSTNRIAHMINAPRNRVHNFLAAVDPRKGPVERTVISITRVKAVDWSTKKQERKEFIYYEERWEGKNWLGVPINPIDGHVEGRYIEVITKPIFDEVTGIHKENAFGGTRESYYIPFTEKNVNEIISNSAKTDRYSIKYVVKFGLEDGPEGFTMSSRNYFSYDMFLWPWDKLKEWQFWPVDDLLNRPKALKSGTANKLEFKPQ